MSIIINESGKKITVEIDGEEYGFLERHARAMNACPWTGGDNTALSVFEEFAWTWTERLLSDVDDDPSQTLAGDIFYGIATEPRTLRDAPPPLDRRRRRQLARAFEAEGLVKRKGGLP